MSKRRSFLPLKRRSPKWYCIAQSVGTVKDMASYQKKLYYIMEKRDISNIKKMLGNPKFFSHFSYLLVTMLPDGEYDEIFGVVQEDDTGTFGATNVFAGDVYRLLYGWADKKHVDALRESSALNCPDPDVCGI